MRKSMYVCDSTQKLRMDLDETLRYIRITHGLPFTATTVVQSFGIGNTDAEY